MTKGINIVYAVIGVTNLSSHTVSKTICVMANEDKANQLANILNEYRANIETLVEIYKESKRLYNQINMKEKEFFPNGIYEVTWLGDVLVLPIPLVGMAYDGDCDIEEMAKAIMKVSLKSGDYIWPANL